MATADASESQPPVSYNPDEVLAQLKALPERNWNAKNLLIAHEEQHAMVLALKAGLKEPEAGVKLLAQWLHSIYTTVSAIPAAIKFHQLDMSIVVSGLLQPFIMGMNVETKRMEIGLPTNPEVVCESLPEVLLVAGAAWATYWHYLNFRHSEDSVPSDDASLLFTSLGITSLSQQNIFDTVQSELSALGLEGFGASELKWLLHYIRSELTGWFASVQYLLGDDRAEESLTAQQQDRLALIKSVSRLSQSIQVGNNPLGYLLYARSCLQFQQHRPANIFASKALIICDAIHEEVARPQLMCIQAMTSVLGGAGNTYSPRQAADSLLAARRALQQVTTWLPAPYHSLLKLGPEDGALVESVLGISQSESESAGEEEAPVVPERPAWEINEEELAAVEKLQDEQVEAKEAIYATPAPTELPVGCITQLRAEAKRVANVSKAAARA